MTRRMELARTEGGKFGMLFPNGRGIQAAANLRLRNGKVGRTEEERGLEGASEGGREKGRDLEGGREGSRGKEEAAISIGTRRDSEGVEGRYKGTSCSHLSIRVLNRH